jgi:hypothetical protein
VVTECSLQYIDFIKTKLDRTDWIGLDWIGLRRFFLHRQKFSRALAEGARRGPRNDFWCQDVAHNLYFDSHHARG